MRKIFILISLTLIIGTLSAQEKTYEYKLKPIAHKLQLEAGENFVFVSFRIAGIRDKNAADNLLKVMENTFTMKKYQLTEIGKFSGFIEKSVSADSMRKFLTDNGYDFDYSTVIVKEKKYLTK